MNDDDYMVMALELAALGAGHVSPNPMVGAVVVKDGQVVGKGYHLAVGGPHAEVHALDAAADKAAGATLYVTLEPCNHYGRTPACTHKILSTGIKRVVVAMADPNPDVTGGGNHYLQTRGIEITCGVQEKAAKRLNESFVKFIRSKRPFVTLKMAATLDGRIATRTGDARWVTGEAARQRVHRMRHAVDAILVGVGTIAADNPQLTTRLGNGRVDAGVDPIRFVLDTRLRISESALVLTQPSAVPTYVVCGPEALQSDRLRLSTGGARLLEAPVKGGHIDLDALMTQLGQMGVTSLLIEGGAQVAGSALVADIVDKVVLFYAPKILRGDDGIPMFRGAGPNLMKDAVAIHDITVDRIGEDIMIQGYRHPAQ
jgi:diaminohydroxyphosphoribosylaminopyrimidine deaminase / 5-amino-6-(5-phosphoribosylamino)uracil reductase